MCRNQERNDENTIIWNEITWTNWNKIHKQILKFINYMYYNYNYINLIIISKLKILEIVDKSEIRFVQINQQV